MADEQQNTQPAEQTGEPSHNEVLEGNIKSIQEAVSKVSDLDALKSMEAAGQNRSSVHKAIDAESAKRANSNQKSEQPAEQTGPVYVMEKNFGWVERGVHNFIEAGKEFIEADESALIAKLHSLGAAIGLKK